MSASERGTAATLCIGRSTLSGCDRGWLVVLRGRSHSPNQARCRGSRSARRRLRSQAPDAHTNCRGRARLRSPVSRVAGAPRWLRSDPAEADGAARGVCSDAPRGGAPGGDAAGVTHADETVIDSGELDRSWAGDRRRIWAEDAAAARANDTFRRRRNRGRGGRSPNLTSSAVSGTVSGERPGTNDRKNRANHRRHRTRRAALR